MSDLWSQWKDDPERPLTAILTLNTIAHTVGALGVGAEVQTQFGGGMIVHVVILVLTLAILLLSEDSTQDHRRSLLEETNYSIC